VDDAHDADDRRLVTVLSEFASTLATDFSITSILDHVVRQITGILPVTSAGITLIEPHEDPRYVAASDAAALRFEELQSALGEGPCLLAYQSGTSVAVPDLGVEHRFPQFSPAAVASGLKAVFTFPLNHGSLRLGALDLYRDSMGLLNVDAMKVAQTLADVAAAYILNARAREEAHANSEELRHIATHDALTSLPNRVLLLERIEHAALRARRSNAPTAILFLDLDRFKRVNDTYGHETGDELLCAVGERLSRMIRPGDTLARVDGDEFVLLCEDLRESSDVDVLLARVQQAFATPFLVGEREISVSASVGVAYAGPGQPISGIMVAKADNAMYQAMREGIGRRRVVGLRDAPRSPSDDGLARDLREAVSQQRLDIAYQPIVRCHDGQVTGVEALLRWTHPKLGPISPLSVVALAERVGVIRELGFWVLERSCQDHARWLRADSSTRLDLAVNVSAHQLMDPNFAGDVRAILDRTGMAASHLVLEVTETVLIENLERARGALLALKTLGVQFALDDFGTGHSSLSYLHRLPIDIVKIDREFVADSDLASKRSAITAAVTHLAHTLDLTVVTEGVETLAHRTAAVEVGADFAQGYYFARPIEGQRVEQMLSRKSPDTIPLRLPLQPSAEDRGPDLD
jgi:diguanylate cyclase (GGDEF)-like protein